MSHACDQNHYTQINTCDPQQVQVSQTLACILMGNQELQTSFWDQEDFSYDIILELLQAQDRVTSIFITVYPTFNPQSYLLVIYLIRFQF